MPTPTVIQHLRLVATKFVVLGAIMLAISAFFAWRLSGLLGRDLPLFYVVSIALVPLMSVVGLGWALFLMRLPLWHPALRRLEVLSAGATQRVINAFEAESFVVRHGPLCITQEAAVLLAPWGLEARFMEDLAWVHPTVHQVSMNGVIASSFLAITLRYRRDPPLELAVTPDHLNALTAMLERRWPRVVVGWSEEHEARWVEDRSRFGRG